ncbi:MAG: Crp/Fnr family transcriptional regulator [Proteobacteria bacterium]|nr:Crp/Fnr family transcriptional regulator [Pseudomonadota bacterium]
MRRLENHATLSEAEKGVLRHALSSRQLHKQSRASIATRHPADGLTIILAGFAYRYQLLAVGRRHISGYFVAGDLCTLRQSSLSRSDYYIGTLGPTETAILSPGDILSEPERHPNLTRALWCAMLAEQSIAREWISNVGPRTAYERVAHLFCEMFVRLQWVGLTRQERCSLPLTQRDLADALSLSAVHVNRVLRQMRLDGLLTFHRGLLIIPDLAALRIAAGFDSTYLHPPTTVPI